MDYHDFANKILEAGKDKFSDMDIYLEVNNEKLIIYSNEELDKFHIAESGGLSLRVRKDGKQGIAYTEQLSEEAIPELLRMAEETLLVNETDESGLPELVDDDEKVNIALEQTEDFEADKWLKCFKNMSVAALEASDDTHRTEIYAVQNTTSKLIMNSKGLDKQSTNQINIASLFVILRRGDVMKNHQEFFFFDNIDEIKPQKFAQEVVDKAASKFGAKSTNSGKKAIVLDKRVISDLLTAFESSFSGENVAYGMSSLQGKLGEKIASDKVTIISDPLSSLSPIKVHFDDEGVATKKLALVENGILKNYLYDLESAKRVGKETTGNSGRSYKGQSHPTAWNLTLVPGEFSQEDLFEKAGEGIYITDIQGLHSGLSVVSGDFSAPVTGYMIKNGKIGRPVNQITIASNLTELLSNIVAVASELKVSDSGTIAPSVLVRDVSVSGE